MAKRNKKTPSSKSKAKPKAKAVKTRKPNNWAKIKSYLWQEQKERGVYAYNSKNFNTLVSDVYRTLGKKFPKDKRLLQATSERSEYELFTAPSPEPEPIEYYNIDRALSSYQSNSFYDPFTVVTNFGGEYPDVEIPLANYDYQGSAFQELVEKADNLRRQVGMRSTPLKKLVIAVDHKEQKIKIFVAGQAPPAGTKPGKSGYKNIAKTPEMIEKQASRKGKIQSELSKIDAKIEENEAILSRLLKLKDKEFIKLSKPILLKMNELQDKKSQLSNENKEVDRYLASAEGFKKEKKSGKKRAKAKPKGSGAKRKRK